MFSRKSWEKGNRTGLNHLPKRSKWAAIRKAEQTGDWETLDRLMGKKKP